LAIFYQRGAVGIQLDADSALTLGPKAFLFKKSANRWVQSKSNKY
jgi:hypothetical protein